MRVGIVVLTYNEHFEFSPCFNEILNSLKSQKMSGQLDVLFMDNKSGPLFRQRLREFCEASTTDKLTFSFLSEADTSAMFNSLNLGFDTFRLKHEYDVLCYSSDDSWLLNPDSLELAVNELDSSVAISSMQCESINSVMIPPDNSKSYFPRLEERGGPPIVMKLEEGVCFHFGLFTRQYLDAYDFRYPDIFQSFASENALPFMCSAIDKSWTLSRRSLICNGKFRYPVGRVGRYVKQCAKRGISAHPWRHKGFSGMLVEPSIGKTFEQIIDPALSLGMGFQTWVRFAQYTPAMGYWADYDPSCYEEGTDMESSLSVDRNIGRLKNPGALYEYLKQNLFIEKPDYETRRKNSDNLLQM